MSEFLVSARKYRPLRFEDVVGQEHITTTLRNAIRSGQLAHSFLFCGPRGVGKTTCARILAQSINCEAPVDGVEPCGSCGPCTSFRASSSFNIYEIDAASNNSVEDIRALTDQVRFPPQAGRYKVYIIDEVHMLSQAAFNAFLKTLEEPPPYAVFILATTEKHKIIPTILSRCQIFDFSRIRVQEIAGHLQAICERENIPFEPQGLHVIAQKADGGMRDALSMFDRILAFSGGKLPLSAVLENLNILDYDVYFGLMDSFLAEDLAEVLHVFQRVLERGFEGDVFLSGLAEHLRNLLVARDTATHDLLESSEELRERYLQQAAIVSPSWLVSALSLLNQADLQFKASRHKRLHVETALVRLTYLNRAFDLGRLAGEGQIVQAPARAAAAPTAAAAAAAAPTAAPAAPAASAASEKKKSAPESGGLKEAEGVVEPASAVSPVDPPAAAPAAAAPAAVEPVAPAPAAAPVPANTPPAAQPAAPPQTSVRLQGGSVNLNDLQSALLRKPSVEPPPDQAGEGTSAGSVAASAGLGNSDEGGTGDAALPPDLDRIQAIWAQCSSDYAAQGRMSVAKLMESALIRLDERRPGGVEVVVGNSIQHDMLKNEMPAFRENLNQAGVVLAALHLRLEPGQAGGPAKSAPYTSQEKLAHMVGKNPAVQQLRDQLGLELEF